MADAGVHGDDELGPLLDLAREIKREVDRIVADDDADLDELTDVIERLPRAERERVAMAVFERLEPDVQWGVLGRVFDDAELRELLADEHRRRRAEVERLGVRSELMTRARESGALDTRELVPGDELVIDLFRSDQVRSAIGRDGRSDAAARSLTLRSIDADRLRVIDDVFNPRGGFFVTGEYDASSWEAERVASHDVIRIGAVTLVGGEERFEPVVHLGARLDVERDAQNLRGHLHVGLVMLGGNDVFAGPD